MKFLHMADLHLGKIVNGFSMLEDQKYALSQVLAMAKEYQIQGILLAGDIYDRSIPPVEAVKLFDEFLYQLESMKIAVYIIAGNHDSKERLLFGSRILEKKHIYIEGQLTSQIPFVETEDEYGILRIYQLPFFHLAEGRELFSLERGSGYEDVIRCLLEKTEVDTSVRNICMTHLFVVPAKGQIQTCDSEMDLSVGGVESVPSQLFDVFDYTALGHIHGPQRVGSDQIRYSGSLLKYSFSEEFHKKSVVYFEIKEKGVCDIKWLPLKPFRDMRSIRGKCKDLIQAEIVQAANAEDYVAITLTDEEEILEPAALLRTVYPNVMQIRFLKNEQKYDDQVEVVKVEERSPISLFESFLTEVRGETDDARIEYVEELIEEIMEEEQ
ncbi:MAG: exonuclease SbcCD subunit D [Lachnospiraceae bacterium]|nr:exonuclease SbcCD subunit D [Lachnospiraceae bacterium]